MSVPLFERHPLPRYFAVLRATSGGGPSYQFCETECEPRDLPFDTTPVREFVSIVKNAEIPVDILKSLERKIEEESTESKIQEFRMRNEAQSDIDVRKVRYWHLNHYFFWNEYKIPVLDFTKRFFLTRTFTRIIPPNTDSNSLYYTSQNYNWIRERVIVKIPLSQGGGALPKEHEIPQFVMKLLYEDKVVKNESCSITMTPFRELSSVGVTPCFHLFDIGALSRWIQSHRKCPLCRKQAVCFQTYDTSTRGQ